MDEEEEGGLLQRATAAEEAGFIGPPRGPQTLSSSPRSAPGSPAGQRAAKRQQRADGKSVGRPS